MIDFVGCMIAHRLVKINCKIRPNTNPEPTATTIQQRETISNADMI